MVGAIFNLRNFPLLCHVGVCVSRSSHDGRIQVIVWLQNSKGENVAEEEVSNDSKLREIKTLEQ
jgi:hypothetical protein